MLMHYFSEQIFIILCLMQKLTPRLRSAIIAHAAYVKPIIELSTNTV